MLSTNTALKEALHGRRCLKDHDHAKVQGKETEHTAGYPKGLCEKMARVFLRSSRKTGLELQKLAQAMPAVRVRMRKKGKDKFVEFDGAGAEAVPAPGTPGALSPHRPPTIAACAAT